MASDGYSHSELPSEDYAIRQARSRDIPHLASIELSAAKAFLAIPALAWLAETGETLPLSTLSAALRAGRLWVATYNVLPVDYDTPIAFLCMTIMDSSIYINEVSVMQQHQGKGLGKLLVKVAEDYAKAVGLTRVSLTTDREARWNGPFYSKLGYRETSAEFVGPSHLAIVEKEEAQGLDMTRRCVMIKTLDDKIADDSD